MLTLGKMSKLFCACLIATLPHMKIDFQYSTDFYGMNAKELSDTCMHLLCTAGEGSFVFNERCYHITKNDLVVIPMPARVKNLAGHSVSSYIHRHTVPILKNYLGDERLSLTQIAELMDFSSLSHFSRYCSKHLGQSPSDYRQSLQPKRE